MNPSKAWAMLAARGVRPGNVGGGRPHLTAAEIARLLRGLEQGPFLMGMAMETSDLAVIPDLEHRMCDEIAAIEQDYGWRVQPQQRDAYYLRLASLAIYEALSPRPEDCSTCHNRGYTIVMHQGVPCLECGQTGGHTLTAHRRSYLVGMAWRTWNDTWAGRYERIHAAAHGWHGEALTHLRKALSALFAQPTERRADFAQPRKMG